MIRPRSYTGALQDLVEQIAGEAQNLFAAFAAAFIYAFEELAADYEAASPDADVRELLRRIGLQAAGSAEPEG